MITSSRYFFLFLLVSVFFVGCVPPDRIDLSTSVVLNSEDFNGSILQVPESSSVLEILQLTSNNFHEFGVFTPDGKKIVYTRSSGRNRPLWIMNSNGTEKRMLTSAEVLSYNITSQHQFVSPDGQEVTYTGQAPKEYEHVAIMTINGSNNSRLTKTGVSSRDPSFSPDGNNIVFLSEQGGSSGLFIMDKNGKNVKNIMNYGTYVGFANYKFTGNGKLSFTQNTENKHGSASIFLMSLDGSDKNMVVETRSFDSPYSFTSDEKYLFFLDTDYKYPDVWVFDLISGEKKRITTFRDDNIFVSGMALSPDNASLAIVTSKYGENPERDLWLLNITTLNKTKISSWWVQNVEFNPVNSKEILFTGSRDHIFDIFLIRLK